MGRVQRNSGIKAIELPLDGNEEGIEISPREIEILKLVVANYIKSAQPISSLFITQNYNIGLSSATVRSVLGKLEVGGFIYSPHRSSGRIPTEKGYRLYITHMDLSPTLAEADQRYIQSEYLKHELRMEQILDGTSRILSFLTNCAGIVISPEREKTVLKHIELVDMGEDELLIILVTRSGMVYSKTVFLEERIPADYLRRISSHLNSVFKGCDLEEFHTRLRNEALPIEIGMSPELPQYLSMVMRTITANFAGGSRHEEVYTCGMDKFFSQLNKEILRPAEPGNIFESDFYLNDLFKEVRDVDEVNIMITGDTDARLSGISIISAPYKMGERCIGALGVVGPNRMDYIRTTGLVDFVSQLMSSMITRISN